MKYAAFISYRHGGIDEKVGIQIQREIERYRLPAKISRETGKKTLGKVFRDADDLRAASNLSEIIKEGLNESEYLIAICTKRYKESIWCMEEIEYFMQIRGRDNIIVVLVEGEPYESFPKILTRMEQDGEIVNIEPLAVDVRADSEKEILKLVSRERLRFISQMLNLDYDDLRQRQRERQRRQVTALAALVFGCLSIFIGVVSLKNIQLNTAYDRLDQSMQQTLKGQSYYLAEYATEAYQNGDRTTAALLALQALPSDLSNPDRPFVPSVMRSLTDALGIYDFSSGYQADKVFDFEEESYNTKVEISQDKKLLLVEKYQSSAANMLEGRVYIYKIQTRKMLGSYPLAMISKTSVNQMSHCARLMQDSKTMVYLAEDGLRAVDVYTKRKKFSGEKGSQLVLSEKNDVIALYDSDKGMLYYYDKEGKRKASTDLGTEKKYTLYCISPDSSLAVLSQDAEGEVGILLADTTTGMTLFVDKTESCRQISFINDHSLCFVRQDTQIGRNHIVVFDLNKNTDNYLVDTDKNIEGFSVSGYESCFLFQDKTVYEISSKTGKIIWQNTYSSEVVSLQAQGNCLAVTLNNGQSYFYNSKKQKLINIVQGNTESFYMLALSEDYACMGDYWGQNIRVYTKEDNERSDVVSMDISQVNASVPEKWYTALSDGDTFLLDFKNGMEDTVQVFSAENLQMLGNTTLKKMDYESFDNLSLEAGNEKYISVQDYAYGENAHFDVDTMEKIFSFDEDSYYFYNDDKSKITIAENKELVTYDAVSGKELLKTNLPSEYDRGTVLGTYFIFGSDTSICIAKEGAEDVVLKDAVIYTTNEKNKLLFYRNQKGTRWFVYSLEKNQVMCSGDAGTYSCTILFDDGRYFLNDYNAVYDTKTWKKSLDLSSISTGVYGVSTREDLPYFIVWYQSGDTNFSGKSTGSSVAYLYNKEKANDIVGVIPNYVATARDGKIIVFDGDHTLYKMPLYSIQKVIKKAKSYVKDIELTDRQKEKYHIYSK